MRSWRLCLLVFTLALALALDTNPATTTASESYITEKVTKRTLDFKCQRNSLDKIFTTSTNPSYENLHPVEGVKNWNSTKFLGDCRHNRAKRKKIDGGRFRSQRRVLPNNMLFKGHRLFHNLHRKRTTKLNTSQSINTTSVSVKFTKRSKSETKTTKRNAFWHRFIKIIDSNITYTPESTTSPNGDISFSTISLNPPSFIDEEIDYGDDDLENDTTTIVTKKPAESTTVNTSHLNDDTKQTTETTTSLKKVEVTTKHTVHSETTTHNSHSNETTSHHTTKGSTNKETTTPTTTTHSPSTISSGTSSTKRKLFDWLVHPHHVTHKAEYKFETNNHYHMSILIVADTSFVNYHRNMDYDTYIMTVMNMAADYLHDVTLGVNIDLSVARTIYIENGKQFHCGCSVDSLLENFCSWARNVNPSEVTHPHHHDVAVLVTRNSMRANKKCGELLGASYAGGACVLGKSCAVVEDSGLLLGVSIAHQIGHLLGMPHDDGLKTRCPSESQDKVASSVVFRHVMAPTPKHGVLVWSQCSRRAIAAFFQRGLGSCLDDEPPKSMLAFPEILPGVMYDADYQCHLMVPKSKACYLNVLEFCGKLFCRTNSKTTCWSNGERPAQGTPCGIDKWCFNGVCVHSGERPGSINGGWGVWGGWSACTRTCGAGVQSSKRACDTPSPGFGGRYCLGDTTRFRTCNTQQCNHNEPSFRSVQCSSYDRIMLCSHRHTWRSLSIRATDRCGLYCVNEYGLKVKFKARAMDGTPCRSGGRDRCINGVCMKIGCDWVIGSTASEDRCGICGGDGLHCHLVEGLFNTTDKCQKGYSLITVIPKGSRKVRVYEVSGSRNNLAISSTNSSNHSEQFYYIGQKQYQTDGEFMIGNIVGIYTQWLSDAAMVLINGPLPNSIRLYVILEDTLQPVHYSYMDVHAREQHSKRSVNITDTPIPPEQHETTIEAGRKARNPFLERHNPLHWNRYQWEYLVWSECSARCEVGTTISMPHCVSVWFGRVSDSYCDPARKPEPRVRVCNEHPCVARWHTGEWTQCHDGIQWRTVQCVRESRSYMSPRAVADPKWCHTSQPHAIRPCVAGASEKCQSCQSKIFELEKLVQVTEPTTTEYYLAVLDPDKRSPDNMSANKDKPEQITSIKPSPVEKICASEKSTGSHSIINKLKYNNNIAITAQVVSTETLLKLDTGIENNMQSQIEKTNDVISQELGHLQELLAFDPYYTTTVETTDINDVTLDILTDFKTSTGKNSDTKGYEYNCINDKEEIIIRKDDGKFGVSVDYEETVTIPVHELYTTETDKPESLEMFTDEIKFTADDAVNNIEWNSITDKIIHPNRNAKALSNESLIELKNTLFSKRDNIRLNGAKSKFYLFEKNTKRRQRVKRNTPQMDEIHSTEKILNLKNITIHMTNQSVKNDHIKIDEEVFKLEIQNKGNKRIDNITSLISSTEVSTNTLDVSKDTAYLIIKLSNNDLQEINKIFESTDKIAFLFKNDALCVTKNKISTHKRLSQTELYCPTQELNNNKSTSIIVPSGTDNRCTHKVYDFDDLISKNKIIYKESRLPRQRCNIFGSSNEFVTKIPLKIYQTIVSDDGTTYKLTDYQIRNNEDRMNWVLSSTLAPIFITSPLIHYPISFPHAEHFVFKPGYSRTDNKAKFSEDKSENYLKNVSNTILKKLVSENRTICLDVNGGHVTINSLYNIINVYCNDSGRCAMKNYCLPSNLPSVNSFVPSNSKNQTIKKDLYRKIIDDIVCVKNKSNDYTKNVTISAIDESLYSENALDSDYNYVEITLRPLASKKTTSHDFKVKTKTKLNFFEKYNLFKGKKSTDRTMRLRRSSRRNKRNIIRSLLLTTPLERGTMISSQTIRPTQSSKLRTLIKLLKEANRKCKITCKPFNLNKTMTSENSKVNLISKADVDKIPIKQSKNAPKRQENSTKDDNTTKLEDNNTKQDITTKREENNTKQENTTKKEDTSTKQEENTTKHENSTKKQEQNITKHDKEAKHDTTITITEDEEYLTVNLKIVKDFYALKEVVFEKVPIEGINEFKKCLSEEADRENGDQIPAYYTGSKDEIPDAFSINYFNKTFDVH